MDRKKDINIVLVLVHKIGKILKREMNYDKENSKDNILSISQSVKNDDNIKYFDLIYFIIN